MLDGWRCEDFSGQTGHAIGRSAQLGDLQICVTAGEAASLPSLSESVMRWLMTGERPQGPVQDKRQVVFSFASQESA